MKEKLRSCDMWRLDFDHPMEIVPEVVHGLPTSVVV